MSNLEEAQTSRHKDLSNGGSNNEPSESHPWDLDFIDEEEPDDMVALWIGRLFASGVPRCGPRKIWPV